MLSVMPLSLMLLVLMLTMLLRLVPVPMMVTAKVCMILLEAAR